MGKTKTRVTISKTKTKKTKVKKTVTFTKGKSKSKSMSKKRRGRPKIRGRTRPIINPVKTKISVQRKRRPERVTKIKTLKKIGSQPLETMRPDSDINVNVNVHDKDCIMMTPTGDKVKITEEYPGDLYVYQHLVKDNDRPMELFTHEELVDIYRNEYLKYC